MIAYSHSGFEDSPYRDRAPGNELEMLYVFTYSGIP